jgi:restriction endonuclease S subunit
MKLSTMIKKEKVASITDIRIGLITQPSQTGTAAYLQVRQFNEEGRLVFEPEEFVIIDNKTNKHILEEGDVLFTGKGNRLFAWCYHQLNYPAVASSVFFVLRPNPSVIYPPYLAAFLNAPQSKASFQQIGSGTSIPSIRKSELGAYQIPIPSLDQQKKIASLAQLHQQEVELAQQIIVQKKNLYATVISKLIQ